MIKANALRCFEHGDIRVLCQDGGFATLFENMSRHKADHGFAIPSLTRSWRSTDSRHFPMGLRIRPDRCQSSNGLMLNNGAIAKAFCTILHPVLSRQWRILGPVSPGQGIVVPPVQPTNARAVSWTKRFGCTDQTTISHSSSLHLRSRALLSAFC
jgi:hypothetical protein